MTDHTGEVYRNRKTDELGTLIEARPVFVAHKKTLEFRLRYHETGTLGIYPATEFYRLFERVED